MKFTKDPKFIRADEYLIEGIHSAVEWFVNTLGAEGTCTINLSDPKINDKFLKLLFEYVADIYGDGTHKMLRDVITRFDILEFVGYLDILRKHSVRQDDNLECEWARDCARFFLENVSEHEGEESASLHYFCDGWAFHYHLRNVKGSLILEVYTGVTPNKYWDYIHKIESKDGLVFPDGTMEIWDKIFMQREEIREKMAKS